MSVQDAKKALARAGKSSLIAEIYDKHSAKASARYEEIRAEQYRPERERELMAKAYLSVSGAASTELEAEADSIASAERADAERVFGVHGLPGDRASLTISQRDASDRVSQVSGTDELLDLLRRATRSGDEVLARAIAQRATEGGYDKVMNAFIADRPSLDAPAQRLWNAERASETADTSSLGGIFGALGLRPPELQGLADYEIDALASDAGSVSTSRDDSGRGEVRSFTASFFGGSESD